MGVCLGCGLIQDISGTIYIDSRTNSDWSGDGWPSVPGASLGAPVYCDAAGQLRLPPERASSAVGGGTGGAVGVGFNASAVDGHSRTITIANPSAVRACSYLVVVMVKMTVLINTALLAFRINVSIDGGSPVTRQAEYWGVPGTGYSIEQMLPEMFSGTLAAGASRRIDIIPGIDASAGGAGTFTQQVVNHNAILVTQAT